jgi:hypothetical protein
MPERVSLPKLEEAARTRLGTVRKGRMEVVMHSVISPTFLIEARLFHPIEQKSGMRIHDLFQEGVDGRPPQASLPLLDRRHRLAGQPRKSADLSFQGEPLGRVEAMLQGVAAPPAPCIRQTLDPRTAGDRHGFPLRFDLAWHLDAWCDPAWKTDPMRRGIGVQD